MRRATLHASLALSTLSRLLARVLREKLVRVWKIREASIERVRAVRSSLRVFRYRRESGTLIRDGTPVNGVAGDGGRTRYATL